MHPKVSGRLKETDGQMKKGMFLHLLPKLFHQMVGNSWAIGKSLSVAVAAIVLVWEEAGVEVTPRDGNINSSTCNHQDDVESGFEV